VEYWSSSKPNAQKEKLKALRDQEAVEHVEMKMNE
jgi:hypothetical protein